MATSEVNDALMQLKRRAERVDRDQLVSSFQDVGPLLSLLSTEDHQVLYGRRGTGKTHTFQYLADTVEDAGGIACYVDLRTVGSGAGIIGDSRYSISERGTRLLVDLLEQLYSRLYEFCVEVAEDHDLSVTGPKLDLLADEITNLEVIGSVEVEEVRGEALRRSTGAHLDGALGAMPNIRGSLAASEEDEATRTARVSRSGEHRYSLRFGSIGTRIRDLLEELGPRRLWLFLDEWSSLPDDIQPVLADFIRRALLPVASVTAKIAAIEQRSRFKLDMGRGYIGIELGADMAADVDLDDLMVFENDPEQARAFFQEFLYKHFRSVTQMDPGDGPQSGDELIRVGFTQSTAFDEFIRAAEGVPRDAINILSQAARRAGDQRISVPHIRTASRRWYETDKRGALRTNEAANEMLNWIIHEVIGERRARAFLLEASVRDPVIESLFDARLLHILKRNISTHDSPGIRFHAYKLDYGCYVDRMLTSGAPQMTLGLEGDADEDVLIDVPSVDYRSIRRAILKLDEFYSHVEHRTS